jgi:glucosamine--fructose-6-phosphate aminotransferase (isomerizing)
MEQPALLQGVLASQAELHPALRWPKSDVRRFLGLAEGSSKHALEMAKPFLDIWSDAAWNIIDPNRLELFIRVARDSGVRTFGDTFLLAVSQSGETASILHALSLLAEHRGENLPEMLAVTNFAESSLARQAGGNVLPLGVGKEQSIAATKTLTASLMTLLLWGLALGEQRLTLPTESVQRLRSQLAAVPGTLTHLFEGHGIQAATEAFARELVAVNHFVLLSKGLMTRILPEAGLKMTETSRNIVYFDNTESFKHGPKVILSATPGATPNTVYMVPVDAGLAERLYKDIHSHFQSYSAEAPSRVYFVRFENSPPVPQALSDLLLVRPQHQLVLPAVFSSFEAMFSGLVAFQLISYYLAALKGDSPDQPDLSKVVT